jgi:hypothetical protein
MRTKACLEIFRPLHHFSFERVSLAKTPRRLTVIHVTCDTTFRMSLILNALLILARDSEQACCDSSAESSSQRCLWRTTA